MKCPYCGQETKDGSRFCEECGSRINFESRTVSEEQAEQLANSSAAVFALGKAARQQRLDAVYAESELISNREYNIFLVGTVLWGLVVNAILCVYVGDVYRFIDPVLFLVLYFVLAFAGILITKKSADPIISFIGYNMIVLPFGLVVSTLVDFYGGLDSRIVFDAFAYTALVTAGMLCATVAFPELFTKLGGALAGILLGVVLCELVLLIFRVQQRATDWICAGVFSLYIGYDIYRSQQFAKTINNAIDCAADIYLDIANLFVRLLRIIARSKKND